uniref:Sulfatase domain-containing protein n=1 Tax=Strongyloides papillosus TaxID=174720 RepID=A0A0N5C288_STREA
MAREKTFTVDPEKPLKEVGIEMMKNLGFLGLDHLSKVTKGNLRKSPFGAFTPLGGHIPGFNKNIGDLQQHVHGGVLVIKSDLTGKSEDCGKADMNKTICRNLLKYLTKKYPEVKKCAVRDKYKD